MGQRSTYRTLRKRLEATTTESIRTHRGRVRRSGGWRCNLRVRKRFCANPHVMGGAAKSEFIYERSCSCPRSRAEQGAAQYALRGLLPHRLRQRDSSGPRTTRSGAGRARRNEEAGRAPRSGNRHSCPGTPSSCPPLSTRGRPRRRSPGSSRCRPASRPSPPGAPAPLGPESCGTGSGAADAPATPHQRRGDPRTGETRREAGQLRPAQIGLLADQRDCVTVRMVAAGNQATERGTEKLLGPATSDRSAPARRTNTVRPPTLPR